MTANEAMANPKTILGIMIVFGSPAHVLFDSRWSKSFVSTSFALHADRELSSLKNKLVVVTPLGEHIIHTSIEMWDFSRDVRF